MPSWPLTIMASDGYLGGIVRYKIETELHSYIGRRVGQTDPFNGLEDVSVETVYNWYECFTIHD